MWCGKIRFGSAILKRCTDLMGKNSVKKQFAVKLTLLMQVECLNDVVSVNLMKMDEESKRKSPLNSQFSFSIEYFIPKIFQT